MRGYRRKQLSNSLHKFYDLDTIGIAEDETSVYDEFKDQIKLENGRYTVKLLFKENHPDSWKYANVQPIHKKGNRQIKSNYRPISLLPICGKILEKIVFDQLYSYLNT